MGHAVTSGSLSATKRLRVRMATGSSTEPRRQASSQGRTQTRPMVAGMGQRLRTASAERSTSSIRSCSTYAGMSTPAGHAAMQGATTAAA